eukprot:gene5419-6758_t
MIIFIDKSPRSNSISHLSSPLEPSRSFQPESPEGENEQLVENGSVVETKLDKNISPSSLPPPPQQQPNTITEKSTLSPSTTSSSLASASNIPNEAILRTQKTRDCNVTIKVFEARSLIEARLRKKDSTKNNKSFKRAQNLLTEISSPNLMTFSDTTDPYCLVQVDKQKQRTRTIPKKLNPFWCEEFTLEVQDPHNAKIILSIMDDKKYSNDEHIGKLIIPINTLKDQKEREMWFPLSSPVSSKKIPQIQILFNFRPLSLADPSQPGQIEWKILYGRNLSASNQPPSANGADFGTPFINWSVRSKKGDTIIEEEGISWFDALNNGIIRELRESIDCINFSVWRYEPKVVAVPTNEPMSPEKRVISTSTSSEPILQSNSSTSSLKISSPDSKTRSSSNAPVVQSSSSSKQLETSSLLTNSSSSISLASNTTESKEGWEPCVIGQGIVLASHLDVDKSSDLWLCLYPKPTAENKFGDVRLKLKYSEEVVLPLESYSPLLEHLQEDDLRTIHLLGQVTKQRESVSHNLIRVFEKTDKCIFLLKSLTEHEIDSTDNPDIIFRGNSLATKSFDLYMKLIGISYLSQTIGPLIKKIYSSKKSCEIDPTKLEKGEDIKKNCKNLMSWVKKMTTAIFSSVNNCPGPLREIFKAIQTKVLQRYPKDEVTRYTAVSGFIFLRFFCPAILAPKLFDLMPDHPGIKTTRSLILIAKTLQNLANLVEFGEYKEDFMRDMNKFVLDNMENMKQFINHLATVPNNCPLGELSTPISLEKELACLYRHLIKQKPEMIEEVEQKNLPKDKESLEKLLSILDQLEQEVLFASTL